MHKNIAGLIKHICIKNKERIAIRNRQGYRTRDITYAELYDKITKTSRLFEKLRIKKSDKILILGKNCVEWVIVFLSAISQGIIGVPLDTNSDTAFIKKIMAQTRPKVIFTSKKMKLGIKTIYFDELESRIRDLIPKEAQKINPKDTAEILYTSGTTDIPKGVVLTNENFLAGMDSLTRTVKLPPLKFISVLPLSHILEQVIGLLSPLYYGSSILYPAAFRPVRLTEIIRNKNINAMICVPAILESLKQPDASKNLGYQFFLIGIGGAKLDTTLEKYWKRKCKLVVQGYGLTETAALVTTNTLFRKKTGSVGRKLPGVEIKLDNNEILVKGKNVFRDYYNDKEKTKQVFTNNWFRTGDLGIFKWGYLYIKGRKKDLIVTKAGENVYPYDIEKVLNSADGIKESCVIDENGSIKAIIIPGRKINPEAVIKKVNLKLMPKQRISAFEIWPRQSFPKTPVGKIKKYLVKKIIKEKKKPELGYGNKLMQIIADITNKKPKPSSTLGYDLLLDSLKRVQLITKIEDEFNVEIAEQRISDSTTVKGIGNLIKKQEKIQKFRLEKWQLNPIVTCIRTIFQEIFFLRITSIFSHIDCKGKENLSAIKEPVIFMSNHQSAFDVACLLRCLPFRMRKKITCVASPQRLYLIPTPKKFRLLMKLGNLFVKIFFNMYPFGNEIGLERSLDLTGEMLDRGYSLFVFPEGRRTKNGKINIFQTGTGFLALNMNAKIVPVKIKGLFEILPISKFWPRVGRVSITFGKPIEIKNVSYIEATKIIEEKVKGLG